ncbi:hypothetical protein K0M31_012640 [Melipona bicolor]|uniref:Uncharacterized protein n=1 Tax=Melipona bicolor TaxID=60889 RepID=A0AA40FKE2_9HYME|nr:hypothetical protein K0M31_012640 [Melipona bicolor]
MFGTAAYGTLSYFVTPLFENVRNGELGVLIPEVLILDQTTSSDYTSTLLFMDYNSTNRYLGLINSGQSLAGFQIRACTGEIRRLDGKNFDEKQTGKLCSSRRDHWLPARVFPRSMSRRQNRKVRPEASRTGVGFVQEIHSVSKRQAEQVQEEEALGLLVVELVQVNRITNRVPEIVKLPLTDSNGRNPVQATRLAAALPFTLKFSTNLGFGVCYTGCA